jgi:hypothetical protein
LAKLPPEVQKQFGYDVEKVKAWEDAQRESAVEAAAIRKKQAATKQWKLTVSQILDGGILASGYKPDDIRVVREGQVGADGSFTPPIYRYPDEVDIFLVGHPKRGQLAEGNKLSVYSYKEGVTNILGRTLEKWVYYEPPK